MAPEPWEGEKKKEALLTLAFLPLLPLPFELRASRGFDSIESQVLGCALLLRNTQ